MDQSAYSGGSHPPGIDDRPWGHRPTAGAPFLPSSGNGDAGAMGQGNGGPAPWSPNAGNGSPMTLRHDARNLSPMAPRKSTSAETLPSYRAPSAVGKDTQHGPNGRAPPKSPSALDVDKPRAGRRASPWVKPLYLALIGLVSLLIVVGLVLGVVVVLKRKDAIQNLALSSAGAGTASSMAPTATATVPEDDPSTVVDDPPVPTEVIVANTVGNQTFLPSGTIPTGPLPDSVVKACSIPGVLAMTFDDGPFMYTNDLLDVLDQLGIKATFFVNGQNRGDLTNPIYSNMVKRAYQAGHCIASHTWNHADLTSLTVAGIQSQMQQVEDAMVGMFGKRPNYMRPPYGRYNDLVIQTIKGMGYATIVLWNQDTADWAHPMDVGSSIQIYRNALATTNKGTDSIIMIEHDVVPTVADLAKRAADAVWRAGWNFVSMEECLNRACYRDP